MMASLEAYAPVERNSVAEQVAKRLLEMVRNKSLKPGDQLPPERELATYLQVSRPSLREALRGLQILGVLKMRQGGGIYVSGLEATDLLGPLQFLITLDSENLGSLHESRQMIDGSIARMAAERIQPAQIASLKVLVEAQKDLLNDPLAFRIADTEFHETIAAATGNPFLVTISHSLYVLGMEYRRVAALSPGVLQRSLVEHRAIVAALAARDPDATVSAMAAHLTSVHETTLEAMAHTSRED
ncbi:FadR family transcriptional regulator [Arsenicitalea aurantiaca]|uniref:FadR family transcriptional regulator n=1 Tax=Arsenicitalea aurantiaca TaxID=1783274 RepID=A0A433XLA4_9HYPH|nr:FadR/GntR family transcriptional regulator [Arsenicitalea aurantiaca]RUT34867.1 FadR family transcriptional regulator [Arsenicitalea aurantiaca]